MICPKCGHESDGKYCSNCGGDMSPLSLDTDNKQQNRNENPSLETEPSFPNTSAPRPTYTDRQSDARHRANSDSSSKSEKRGASRKRSGGKSKSSSGNTKTSDKQIRKELKQRDGRIYKLEEELSNLSLSQRQQNRRERISQGDESGQGLKDMAVKGAVGATVLCSRLMQLACFFLMVTMVYQLFRSFWSNGQNLGNINYMISERNYGLAVYVAFAGVALFFGVIWSLWILSRKDGGGSVRLKKYDTGRGFIPFLICAAIFFLVPIALEFIPSPEQITGLPQIPVEALVWQKAAMGLKAALSAVDMYRNTLILCSLSGAILSLIRRILRV